MIQTRVSGARIRALRQHKRWSQGVLAYKTGTTAPQISRIENNERPGVSAILIGRIAEALDTTVEYLLGQTDNSERPQDEGGEPVDPQLQAQAQELVRRWRLVKRHAPEQLEALTNIAFIQAEMVLGTAGIEVDEGNDVNENTG